MTTPSHINRAPGPLADPFNAALRGRQSRFAESSGAIVRFQPDVSVFYGHPAAMTDDDYRHVAALAGPGGIASLRDRRTPLPGGWQVIDTFDLVLYDGSALDPLDDPEFVVLGPADVPEMTALVELTKPGPIRPRTIELGTYLGWRDPESGDLLAMAGQRMSMDAGDGSPGWTEISAVCTHPAARGRGLATRLIRAVGAAVVAAGDRPFLHTTADNPARGLYESLGFELRSCVRLELVRIPDA